MGKLLNKKELKEFLDTKYIEFNTTDFIEDDPISIPHLFSTKQDIEIAGFLSSVIAWGNRKSIITNAKKMMEFMDFSPYDFILNHSESDYKHIKIKHRTFNEQDFATFLKALKNIYAKHKSLEDCLTKLYEKEKDFGIMLSNFKILFFQDALHERSLKHLPNPIKKSAAKRLCMYFRWMVRKDNKGVDFGIWDKFPTSELRLPLDVHTGNISRKLGVLKRKQNDWEAVEEVTSELRKLDPIDPIKYDFALFGLGAIEKF